MCVLLGVRDRNLVVMVAPPPDSANTNEMQQGYDPHNEGPRYVDNNVQLDVDVMNADNLGEFFSLKNKCGVWCLFIAPLGRALRGSRIDRKLTFGAVFWCPRVYLNLSPLVF